MKQKLLHYFSEIKDPRVVGRCNHSLSDILVVAICTYITGGTDYQDMHMFCKERGQELKGSILLAKDVLPDEILQAWKDLTTIVKVKACRDIKDVRTEKIRYYISNENIPKAAYYQALVRGHWGIENHLHWHLDVTFNEDCCRAGIGHAPENLTIIRKLALQIIADAKDNYSLKKRQYRAALDFGYMKKIIGF